MEPEKQKPSAQQTMAWLALWRRLLAPAPELPAEPSQYPAQPPESAPAIYQGQRQQTGA